MQEKLNTLISSFIDEYFAKKEVQEQLKAEFDKNWSEMFNKAFRDAMQNKAQEMDNKLADVFYAQKPSSSHFTLPAVTCQEYPAEQTTTSVSVWGSLEQIHPSAVVLVTLLETNSLVLSGYSIAAGEIVLRPKGGMSSFSVTLRKLENSIWLAEFPNGIIVSNINKTNKVFVEQIIAHFNQPLST